MSDSGQAELTAKHAFLKLSADYMGMAKVASSEPKKANLAVFVSDKSEFGEKLAAEIFIKQGGELRISRRIPIASDTSAYDVCPDPTTPGSDMIVLLRPDGVYRLGDTQPFIATDTFFAHRQERTMPRIRVCFDIFGGEREVFLIPKLDSVMVFRQKLPLKFHKTHMLPFQAQLRYQQGLLRGSDLAHTQRIAVWLDLPDVQVVDLNSDQLNDICLTIKDRLACYLQDSASGGGKLLSPPLTFGADLLTETERLDTMIRLESRVLDVTGDGKPDFIVNATNWNLASLGTSIRVYPQAAAGQFARQPTSTLARSGYFSYQEYLDFDGDGLLDIVAPYAAIDWRALVKIYLSRNVDIDFVWYKNLGGHFTEKPRVLYSFTYPVDFKNLPAILGALPLWKKHATSGAKVNEPQSMLFFPQKKAIEWHTFTPSQDKEKVQGQRLGRYDVAVGSDALLADMDGDGSDEVIFAYPRDPVRKHHLLFVPTHATP